MVCKIVKCMRTITEERHYPLGEQIGNAFWVAILVVVYIIHAFFLAEALWAAIIKVEPTYVNDYASIDELSDKLSAVGFLPFSFSTCVLKFSWIQFSDFNAHKRVCARLSTSTSSDAKDQTRKLTDCDRIFTFLEHKSKPNFGMQSKFLFVENG